MNLGLQKKNSHLKHRRIKTDLSCNVDHKQMVETIRLKLINYDTQRSRYENRSSVYSKFDQESTRSCTKTPNCAHEFTYNKWYIKPDIRMKKSLAKQMKPKEEDIEYAYNKLYAENTLREDRPFLVNKNEKLKLLDQIPVHNIKLLEVFKRSQQQKKKRVPKIVDLFLKKKTSPEKEEYKGKLKI